MDDVIGVLEVDICNATMNLEHITKENVRLNGKVAMYEEERKYHFEMSRKRIAESKVNTVREMQTEINKTLSALCKGDVSEIRRMIDQIAKEMLEGNNG
jgi:hypothetical protein